MQLAGKMSEKQLQKEKKANAIFQKVMKSLKKKGFAFWNVDRSKPKTVDAVRYMVSHIQEKKRFRMVRFDLFEVTDAVTKDGVILTGLVLVIKTPKE